MFYPRISLNSIYMSILNMKLCARNCATIGTTKEPSGKERCAQEQNKIKIKYDQMNTNH